MTRPFPPQTDAEALEMLRVWVSFGPTGAHIHGKSVTQPDAQAALDALAARLAEAEAQRDKLWELNQSLAADHYFGRAVAAERQVAALEAERDAALALLQELWNYTGRDQYFAGDLGKDVRAALDSASSQPAQPNCHICHRPTDAPGEIWCSYPHPQPSVPQGGEE